MRRYKRILIVGGVVLATIAVIVTAQRRAAQAPAAYRAPRTADGQPDLSGFWQALNTAHYNLEAHASGPGLSLEFPTVGAIGAIPGGLGVVEGGEIPYTPEAAAKRNEHADDALNLDPIVKCYMPGVPRATYMPHPFQIIQASDGHVLIAYEFPSAHRTIRMNTTEESPGAFYMGWSVGRWDGETLVLDVTGFSTSNWLDRVGNFASENLHVVERFTRTGPDLLWYEATIEDPNVFMRPWKIEMPLHRRVDANMRLVEFNCIPYAEELLYGHLRAPWAKKPAGR